MKKSLLERAAHAGADRERRLRLGGDGRRARWGIVHTPAPLAAWAMETLDARLRELLSLPGGLADAGVGLLDVSVGTGVWLAAALEVAGARRPAPAAVLGYDRDSAVLAEARTALAEPARLAGWPLRLREGNTLAIHRPWPRAVRVPVVFGNPPWASRSDSRAVQPTGGWLADFRRDVDGGPLSERRVGVLSDDYVRFFRWSAEQTRHAPAAALCLVTNASFLDGPVHRGMRARLREWFDAIEVLDLGGNALLARGAGHDENVFGVRPGVAVTLALRVPGAPARLAPVGHASLRGRRVDKLAALGRKGPRPLALALADGGSAWRPVAAGSPAWPPAALPLDVAMPFHREGVQTNRDGFASDPDRDALLDRMQRFAAGGPGPPARAHFDPERARAALQQALARDPAGEGWIAPLWYRPFERRWFVTLPAVSHRPRPALLRAAAGDALCLLTARKDRGERPWSLFGASRGVADACFLSTRSSCRTRVFPVTGPDGEPNLDVSAVQRWLAPSGVQGADWDATALVELAVAQLAATGYRRRYDPWLRQDYPRLLPPANRRAFGALRAAGRAVIDALTLVQRSVPPANRRPTCAVGHIEPPVAWKGVCPTVGAGWTAYMCALQRVDALAASGAIVAISNHDGS